MRSRNQSRVSAVAISAALMVGATPSVACAYTVTFCVDVEVTYGDSSIGEDYWTDAIDLTYREARGAYYQIINSVGSVVASGWLGDGENGTSAGCTGNLSLSAGYYDVRIESKGVVAGNNLFAGDTTFTLKSLTEFDRHVNANGNYNVDFQPSLVTGDVFNVYVAAAWALYREESALSARNFKFEVNTPTPCSAGTEASCNTDSEAGEYRIYIGGSGNLRKYLIAHELGHLVGRYATSGKINGGINYSYNGQLGSGESLTGACAVTPVDHALKDLEWVGTGVGEGYADFYSARTFNQYSATDCWFETGGNTNGVNCEFGTTADPLAWVDEETCRIPDDPQSGSRLDWVRIFWDVHTDAATLQPTFTYMTNSWLGSATAWGSSTAFTRIDTQAGVLGGDLDDNWNNAVNLNADYYCPSENCQ